MIEWGKCSDGFYRIRRVGGEWIQGQVHADEERARFMAQRFAAGGRLVQTVFDYPAVPPERDDAAPDVPEVDSEE